jgi:predicted nucleic acid-binding Zn ribbon protein
MEIKKCENCGKDFHTIRDAKFCSPECYWDSLNKKRRQHLMKKINEGAV